MQEVRPGIYHWTTVHPKIHIEVSSYWIDGDGVLIDPLIPTGEGLEWFAARAKPPGALVLSNRHHYRHSREFGDTFGCPVYCNRAGLHEFTHGESVRGFDIGEKLPGGIEACELGAICPDDTALYLPASKALLIADSVVRAAPHGQDGPLGFVPDSLMDDPEDTKRAILAACERLLRDLDFEHLLLAHGGPLIDDGRARLQEFVDSGGRTAFEL